MSNKPRAGNPPPHFVDFLMLYSTIFFGHRSFKFFYAKNLNGCLFRPYQRIQFVIRSKTSYFQSQPSPREAKPSILLISCVIISHLFGSSDILSSFFITKLHKRPLRPYLWSWFISMTKTTNFKGKMSRELINPPCI